MTAVHAGLAYSGSLNCGGLPMLPQFKRCIRDFHPCVFLPVECVKRHANTSATTEMQATTMNVISVGVIVYSFVFNIYPTTKKLIPDKMPATRMGNENLSDIIFPKTNAANEILGNIMSDKFSLPIL